MNNPVAKHAHKFNKNMRHEDKRKKKERYKEKYDIK